MALIDDKTLNIKKTDHYGLSLGHLSAIYAADPLVLQKLKQRDPTIFKTVDDRGNLPIHLAAASNQINNTKKLIELSPTDI